MKMDELLEAMSEDASKLSGHALRITGLGTTNAKGQKIVYEPKGPDLKKKKKEKANETTSSGTIATVATPVGGMISRQMKNADGTVKNALDMDTNVMGQKKKRKKR